MEKIKILNLDKNRTANQIKTLIEKHYDSAVKSVSYLGGGSFGMAYRVEQDKEPKVLVAKAYKVSCMHKKESFDLSKLGENTIIPYSKVYFTIDSDFENNFDLLCMEYIEGRDAFTNFGLLFKSKKQKALFANQIVESMLFTHSCTNKKFGKIENPTFDKWLDYYKPFAKEIFEEAKRLNSEGKLDNYIVDTMKQAFDKFDSIFKEKVEQASLIHGDLNVMNIMVKKPFVISAIIDPLGAMYADREYDLFQLNNLTGKRFGLYKMYKSKYKVSENCDIKCAFYGLWNEVFCYLKAGTLFKFIMKPLVKNMKKQLKKMENQ